MYSTEAKEPARFAFCHPPRTARLTRVRNLLMVAAMCRCLSVSAQPAAGPTFDVASVKPSPLPYGQPILLWAPEEGKLHGHYTNLMRLISLANDLPETNISGPSWLESGGFEIEARAQGPQTRAGMRRLIQALLAERFGLQCHRETRSSRVYFLDVARGGLKMPSLDEPRLPRHTVPPTSSQLRMGGDFSMGELADALSKQVQTPVINRTGVAGKFQCSLQWGKNPETDPEPDLFQAVKEQLGLMLEPGKGDVEFLVIDHVNRMPTEN
jgi:uncharacterized protein (TIGR03435 family)